jgi:hypothetical protein
MWAVIRLGNVQHEKKIKEEILHTKTKLCIHS